MRIVFAGTPEVALPPLEALLASRHEVVAVLTRPDAPAGRGKKLTPSPVAARAAELGIETLTPRRPRDEDFVARLSAIAPDCVPVVAYGALLPQRVIDVPRHGFVNLHFSLLPAWRGAAPVQHALLAGDAVTGATTFQIVLELDAGPTFLRVEEPVRPDDTAGDLLARLAVSGAELLVRTLDGIEDGTLTAQPQPAEGVSFAPKIEVDDARVDWSLPAEVVDRRIRGCTPAPGAWTTLGGERLKLGLATPADGELAPGALQVGKAAVLVGTGTRPLRLGRVQAPGKKPMPAADWARGAQLPPDTVLGG
ncbi:methionyl-tRNA formyltransferase [Microlunatus capsulatus]|uniref:Methionyl-tRNA formyltransferase n=1 Tax=Microlunatus capsulatus TaxID=99117 RepID=A0ABS4Z322_9ACTN|nr:methionyl-tRNA formyltransferase [Microlunatus capsulatus]MBP2415433.1 methionyl-tRNA formyltransferase [Microlunatus capsulatus]